MTTIVAIQGDGWSVFAADSQTTDGNNKSWMSKTGKIAQNGDCLIAGAGTVRGLNILAYEFEPPKRNRKWDLDSFMTRQFIPAMREQFKESGYDVKPDNDLASFDNVVLVSINGVIYSIDEAYGWERSDSRIYTYGSGGNIAKGALTVLNAEDCDSVEEAVDLAEQAIKAASKWDSYTGGRIQVAVQYADGTSTMATLDEE